MDITVGNTVTLKADPEFRAEVWAITNGGDKAMLKVDEWSYQPIPKIWGFIGHATRLLEELEVVSDGET